MVGPFRLQRLNWIRCHPYIELPKSDLETLFKILKELSVFRRIEGIDENAYEVISEWLATLPPTTVNDLRFGGDCTKLVFEF